MEMKMPGKEQDEATFLQCYICFQGVRKPRMCPSCSKLTCETCLRKWIDEHKPECPYCRRPMLLSSFADCQRFISDVKHLIVSTESDSLKDKCSEHKVELRYYCNDCKKPICSDCGMFGSKHRGHTITHLNKIYQEVKEKVLMELGTLDRKLEGIRRNGSKMKEQMKKLAIATSQNKVSIETFFLNLMQKLDDQHKEKKERIQGKMDQNTQQIEAMEAYMESITEEVQRKSEKQLIEESEDVIECIKKISSKPDTFEEEEISYDIMQQIMPKYTQFKFILKDALNLADTIIYSPPEEVNGIEWRLKIYPRGNGQAQNTFISVFIEMSKAYVNQSKYDYKIELINHIKKDSLARQFSSKFDIGQCWGYNKFVSLAELPNGFLTDQNELHFSASVRASSYLAQVEDMQRHIQNLQKKLVSSKKNKFSISESFFKKKEAKIPSSESILCPPPKLQIMSEAAWEEEGNEEQVQMQDNNQMEPHQGSSSAPQLARNPI